MASTKKERTRSKQKSRSSGVDSELSELMRDYPSETNAFLDKLFTVDTRRYKGGHDGSKRFLEQLATVAERPTKTHYQETYFKKAIRPRSTKRPPPSPRDPNPPPMTFDTWQRESYKPVASTGRAALLKGKDTFDTGHADNTHKQLNELSMYNRDFTPKEIDRELAGRPISQRRRQAGDDATFYDSTTNKEAFKTWKGSSKSLAFGELPSFTDSLLYPTTDRHMRTTMKDSYPGTQGDRMALSKGVQSSLKMEGAHNFSTVNRETFRSLDEPIERVHPFVGRSGIHFASQNPFPWETQFHHDFPGYKNGQPRPPKPVEPKEATIDLRYETGGFYSTEQREIYRGHDAREHPAPKPCKWDPTSFASDKNNFENGTVTHSDFQPINIGENPVELAKAPKDKGTSLIGGGPMSKDTTHLAFFKNYWLGPDSPRRQRYCAFPEGHTWVPPVHKFNGDTETKRAFGAPKMSGAVKSFKPITEPLSEAGNHDFSTVHNKTYTGERYHLSKQQANLLRKELKEISEKAKPRRSTRQQARPPVAAVA